MYINDSSGRTTLESENMFPAEHFNVTVYLGASIDLFNVTSYSINEGWQYSHMGWGGGSII